MQNFKFWNVIIVFRSKSLPKKSFQHNVFETKVFEKVQSPYQHFIWRRNPKCHARCLISYDCTLIPLISLPMLSHKQEDILWNAIKLSAFCMLFHLSFQLDHSGICMFNRQRNKSKTTKYTNVKPKQRWFAYGENQREFAA